MYLQNKGISGYVWHHALVLLHSLIIGDINKLPGVLHIHIVDRPTQLICISDFVKRQIQKT